MLVRFALVASLLAIPAIPPDLGGEYECRGVGESKYTLKLKIAHDGDNYFLAWEGSQVGMGVRIENVLSVVFVDRSSGGVGVVAYKITDGKLDGIWATGDRQLYTEVCTPLNVQNAGVVAGGAK